MLLSTLSHRLVNKIHPALVAWKAGKSSLSLSLSLSLDLSYVILHILIKLKLKIGLLNEVVLDPQRCVMILILELNWSLDRGCCRWCVTDWLLLCNFPLISSRYSM
jgi:hypothetical protein